ncbi:MAG: arginase family protein [Chloracidobacterium sp.]|nr:arginase family protein [Chloracidobacterium sp.]
MVPTTGTPEPGGLGWYETLALIRTLAEKKRVVGMDLVEYSYNENYDSPAFLCSKLVYKSLRIFFEIKPRKSPDTQNFSEPVR